ncbi:unnamed protein product [Phytophthora lilii]|uniref:Selenoprotein F n=1 Tax=Phytophthora lilii TaxID=2077276 RepID=A0A9W6WT77_9STRA|nr:unnamed protein product [Phytophthora lilii]
MRLPALLLLAPLAAEDAASAVSTERLDRCASFGFDADALDCRLCGDLSTFLEPAKSTSKTKAKAVDLVTEECRDCCSDMSKMLEAEGRRFPKVVLAVSRRRLKRHPKVANFVEHQAEQIKRLEVQETDPRLPMLQFFDENGEKVEEIRCVVCFLFFFFLFCDVNLCFRCSVAHWDEDSIAEFIENKLLPEETEGEGEVIEEVVEEVVEMEVEADEP